MDTFTHLQSEIGNSWGTWVAQSVECLTAQSLEPASDSVSPSLSDPPPIHALSLSVSKINKRYNINQSINK